MTIETQPVAQFIEAVASKQPTPGGGAVASVVAALATALGRMVVNYSVGRKSLAAHDALHQETLTTLASLGEKSLQLADDDAVAYAKLNALWKLDESDPVRLAEMPEAVEQAIAAPHAVLHACMETLRLLERLCGTTNAMLGSDLAMAAILAEAAARSAAWNVRINLPLLDDPDLRETFNRTVSQSLADAAEHSRRIEQACAKPA